MDKNNIANVLENIANGINPESGKEDAPGRILGSPVTIRALFNAAKLLRSESSPISSLAVSTKIEFYRTTGKYGYMSNFSKHAFVIGEKVWKTSEHYFQAKKFEGTPDEEEVRIAETPNIAAKFGRQRSRPLRSDWEQVKDSVMYTALKAKFNQNTDIMKKLISTEGAELVEHTTKDAYWGDGGDGSGKNMLGKLLMKLRDELKGG